MGLVDGLVEVIHRVAVWHWVDGIVMHTCDVHRGVVRGSGDEEVAVAGHGRVAPGIVRRICSGV